MFSEYDKTQEYETYIKEKVRELNVLCRFYKIPFYMTFGVKSDNEGTDYISVAALPPSMDLEVKNDRLRKLILVENDFDVVPHKKAALPLSVTRAVEEEQISDDTLIQMLIEEAEAKPAIELTRNDVEYANKVKQTADAKKARGLGRPKGSTKKKKEEERARDLERRNQNRTNQQKND